MLKLAYKGTDVRSYEPVLVCVLRRVLLLVDVCVVVRAIVFYSTGS